MKPYIRALFNEIRFRIGCCYCKGLRKNGVQLWGYNTKLHVARTSKITLGGHLYSDGRMVIMVDKGASLDIGEYVYFNEDAMISCKGHISIGNNCKFGPNVKIFDNNHKFDYNRGVSDEHSIGSVVVGENCWIGSNVVLLKGASIGDDCVIGAGCVIDSEIPSNVIVTQDRVLHFEEIKEK